MNRPDWKKVQQEDRDAFLKWLTENQSQRMEEGERKYKSSVHGFQGDPLQHAAEEAFDLLFYIFYAMREREDLESRISNLGFY